jgi:hypothetical protein
LAIAGPAEQESLPREPSRFADPCKIPMWIAAGAHGSARRCELVVYDRSLDCARVPAAATTAPSKLREIHIVSKRPAPKVLEYVHGYMMASSPRNVLVLRIEPDIRHLRDPMLRWTVDGQSVVWEGGVSGDGQTTVVQMGELSCGAALLPPSTLRFGGDLELIISSDERD